MKKILLSFAACAMALVSMAESKTFTITSSDITSGATSSVALAANAYGKQDVTDSKTFYTFNAADINFTSCKVCIAPETNGGGIQMQGNASKAANQAFIGNTTSFKDITSIKIYTRMKSGSTFAPQFNIYAGKSELPGSSDTKISAAEDSLKNDDGKYINYTISYDLSGATYSHFAIRNDLVGAVYIDKIELEADLGDVVIISAPTITPDGGTFSEPLEVTIAAPEGFGLIYTTDGTTPAEGVGTTVASGKTTITVEGTKTIKAITIDNDDPDNCSVVKTATFTKSIANTPEKAYTPAQAEAFAKEGLTTEAVYVKGIISSIKSLNTALYKNAQYYIKENADATSEFYIYNGKYLEGKDFTADDQIKVGDEVIVYGKLAVYTPTEGDPVYQMASGNYIYSLNGVTKDTTPVKEVTQIALADFTNGGFENWTESVCDQWKSVSAASSATISKTEDANSGSASILVKGATSNKRLASTEILLEAGTYAIELYAKGTSDEADARLRFGYSICVLSEDKGSYTIDSNNGYKYGDTYLFKAADGWKKYLQTFTLSEPTIINIIVMNNFKKDTEAETQVASPSILIDDVVLRVATDEDKQAVSINTINAASSNSTIYNLNGVKLSAPQKGINIIDGKKVYVK